MTMNLRDVQYFAAIAEHRHLGRAAETLGLSQPALSMSLRRLERFMDTKLVKRTPKGVDLTASGKAVYVHARRLRLSVEDISREVADLSQARSGHLCIGTAPAFSARLLPMACATLLGEAPGVTVKVTPGDRAALLAGVHSGELDLAISTLQGPQYGDLVQTYLASEEYVVMGSVNHRLAKRKQVALTDLVDERWIASSAGNPTWQRLNMAFADAGLPPPTLVYETTDLLLRLQMVAATSMLVFHCRDVALYAHGQLRVAQLQVRDLDYTRRIALVCRRDAYLSPVARRFIEILKTIARRIEADQK